LIDDDDDDDMEFGRFLFWVSYCLFPGVCGTP